MRAQAPLEKLAVHEDCYDLMIRRMQTGEGSEVLSLTEAASSPMIPDKSRSHIENDKSRLLHSYACRWDGFRYDGILCLSEATCQTFEVRWS
jgi:hypothetical protein